MGMGSVRCFSGSRALVVGSIAAVAASFFVAVPAAASSASNTRGIATAGTTSFAAAAVGSAGLQNPEIARGLGDAGAVPTGANTPTLSVDRSRSAGKSAQGSSATESNQDGSHPTLLTSFNGLNHFAQRTANGGNQFSLEPPDQGLCSGNGYVLETVNDVLAVYDHAGKVLAGPIDLNTFYNYIPAIARTTPAVFGPFVTDPSCYFDVATQRWFHVVLTLETDPATGAFLGPNHLDLAVSKSGNPLGGWNVYTVPVQDDGTQGTPNHLCTLNGPNTGTGPCLGDYPHIGADANGFYITTNEYSFFGPEFIAAQVYAFSKQALAAGSANVSLTQINTSAMVRGKQAGFTVWPAETPNGHFNSSGNGTEYFLSSNAASEVNPPGSKPTSTDLIVWTLGNTRSLNSAQPDLSLTNSVLSVKRYAAPPTSNQKAGPTPLRDCINDTSLTVRGKLGCWRLFFGAKPAHEVISTPDSNDTRMQQVTFANGILYGALDTALEIKGKAQAGIEWFAVRPQPASGGEEGSRKATVVNQGYLGIAGGNLTYPALAVNENGVGAMAFTLVGTKNFPSAAYATFDLKSGLSSVHIAAAGVGPDDGFTSYKAFVGNPPRTRWGDYGAAVVDGSTIWMASEYIGQSCGLTQWFADTTCGGTRTALANWGTRVSALAIGGGDNNNNNN